MAKDLEQVKEELYEAFNKAMKGVREFSSFSYETARINSTARAVTAAADAANAIANIERELAERKNGGPSLKMPGK
jgi:hypothetical protein